MKLLNLGLGTVILSGILAVLLAAWDVVQDESTSPRMLMVMGGSGPFWRRAALGAEAAARHQGARLTIKMPAQDGDAAEQSNLIVRAAADAPEVIAVCPVQPGCQQSALAAAARECNVVTFLNAVPESPAICHLGVNPYVAGKRAANLAASWAPTGAKFVLIRTRRDDDQESERACGFRDVLRYWSSEQSGAERPASQIVELTLDPRNHLDLADALRNAVAPHTDAACFVFLGDGRLAAASACDAVGRIAAGKIIVFGESHEILNALRRGHIDAAIGIDPYDAGFWVASTATRWRHRTGLDLPAPGLGRVSLPVRVLRADDLEQVSSELFTAQSFARH
jgi:ABC-type sugar transport system substrate-binding protein